MKSQAQIPACSPGPSRAAPLKKLLPLAAVSLATLGLLLACNQPTTPVIPIPISGTSPLRDQNVALGYGLNITVQQAFSGSWEVVGLPAWLSASPPSGKDTNLNTVLSANRSASVQTSASQPALTSDVKVNWTSSDGMQKGSITLKVSADLYALTGRVQDSASSLSLRGLSLQGLSATDLHLTGGGGVRASTPPARGVIVGYRSQAARIQAMNTLAITAALPGAARLTETVRSAAGQVLTLSTPDVQATIERLKAQPDVVYAVPDAVLTALDMHQSVQPIQAQQLLTAPLNPSDEFAPLQWAFRLLGYPAVWRDMQQNPYTKAVTVAVLDTGVRYDHPDLQGKLYGPGDGALDVLAYTTDSTGKLIYDNGDGDGPDTDPTDPATPNRSDISHGTHVTGIIAANWGSFTPPCPGCSGSGVVGASYTAPIKVLPIRVLDASEGNGSESDIALALRYAAGDPVALAGQTYTNPHPAQVINMSLGGPLSDPDQIKVLCDAVARATTLGSLVVAAGGNFGGTTPVYPAACPGAVAVASVSLSDSAVPTHVYYSDQYQQVALSAPGGQPGTSFNGGTLKDQNGQPQPIPDEILSTGWNYTQNLPGYYLEAGTSQAAPQVTALAALLLSKGAAATPSAALDRMLKTASDLGTAGRDPTYGVGLINPAAALGAAPVSNTLGLSVQDAQGRNYQPVLDSVGRFTGYLPDGSFRVVAGRDSNGNGFAGEAGEPQVEKSVTLGPSLPSFDVGTLTP